MNIKTFTAETGAIIKQRVSLTLRPHFESNVRLWLTALIVQKLNTVPACMLDTGFQAERFPLVKLADPTLGRPGNIDLILGVQQITHFMLNKTFSSGSLLFQETKFGFIAMGSGAVVSTAINNLEVAEEPATMRQLCRFFEQEFEADEKDDFAEEFYKATVQRDESGFIVRIPWKKSRELGASKRITIGRVKSMLRRLSPDMREKYVDHCNELKRNGYKIADDSHPTEVHL